MGARQRHPWGDWCTDCNNYREETTIALEADNCINIPDGFTGIGLLDVSSLRGGVYVFQSLQGLNNDLSYTRYSWGENLWSDWKRVAFVS